MIIGALVAVLLLGAITFGVAVVLDRLIFARRAANLYRARLWAIATAAALVTLGWAVLWRILPDSPEPWAKLLVNIVIIFTLSCGMAWLFSLSTLNRRKRDALNPPVTDIFA